MMSLEQSSGMYLMMTLLRRYRRKPYKGCGSSYCEMAFRISTMPPVPRLSRPTSSREVYLRRNLQLSSASKIASRGNGSAPSVLWEAAYQPPSSAAAASWASLMLASSKPFSDMAMASALHCCEGEGEGASQRSGSRLRDILDFRGTAESSTWIR